MILSLFAGEYVQHWAVPGSYVVLVHRGLCRNIRETWTIPAHARKDGLTGLIRCQTGNALFTFQRCAAGGDKVERLDGHNSRRRGVPLSL